jgi:hypothetical protein
MRIARDVITMRTGNDIEMVEGVTRVFLTETKTGMYEDFNARCAA